jgi:hypothetical protein
MGTLARLSICESQASRHVKPRYRSHTAVQYKAISFCKKLVVTGGGTLLAEQSHGTLQPSRHHHRTSSLSLHITSCAQPSARRQAARKKCWRGKRRKIISHSGNRAGGNVAPRRTKRRINFGYCYQWVKTSIESKAGSNAKDYQRCGHTITKDMGNCFPICPHHDNLIDGQLQEYLH